MLLRPGCGISDRDYGYRLDPGRQAEIFLEFVYIEIADPAAAEPDFCRRQTDMFSRNGRIYICMVLAVVFACPCGSTVRTDRYV